MINAYVTLNLFNFFLCSFAVHWRLCCYDTDMSVHWISVEKKPFTSSIYLMMFSSILFIVFILSCLFCFVPQMEKQIFFFNFFSCWAAYLSNCDYFLWWFYYISFFVPLPPNANASFSCLFFSEQMIPPSISCCIAVSKCTLPVFG